MMNKVLDMSNITCFVHYLFIKLYIKKTGIFSICARGNKLYFS